MIDTVGVGFPFLLRLSGCIIYRCREWEPLSDVLHEDLVVFSIKAQLIVDRNDQTEPVTALSLMTLGGAGQELVFLHQFVGHGQWSTTVHVNNDHVEAFNQILSGSMLVMEVVI